MVKGVQWDNHFYDLIFSASLQYYDTLWCYWVVEWNINAILSNDFLSANTQCTSSHALNSLDLQLHLIKLKASQSYKNSNHNVRTRWKPIHFNLSLNFLPIFRQIFQVKNDLDDQTCQFFPFGLRDRAPSLCLTHFSPTGPVYCSFFPPSLACRRCSYCSKRITLFTNPTCLRVYLQTTGNEY